MRSAGSPSTRMVNVSSAWPGAYDAAGRVSVVVDPLGNRTSYAYDANDNVTTLTTPIGTTTYVYDADKELADQTDANGRRTTFAYDGDGRRTNERWLTSSGGTVETLTYTYDADGELTGATDPNATLTFTYDSGGNQLTAATSSTAGQPSVTLTSGYDTIHDRTTLSDNLATAGLITYTYDGDQRLTELDQSFGGTAGPQVTFTYDSGGRMTFESRTIGGSGTQINTTLSYDAANRVTTIQDASYTFGFPTGTTTPLATYVYGYDNANRVTTEVNAEGTVTYTYNADGELTAASGSRTESYSYDSGGNRTMTGYSVGTDNELASGAGYTYAYDAEGNLTSETQTSGGTAVTTFSYDYRNRLTGETERSSPGGTITLQATYTYDALNRRIGTDVNGTQTWMVWDGQNPYAQFNGSGTLEERYLYGPAVDEILARTSLGGTTAWYLTDRLGSVRDIVDTSGNELDHIVYDSFGNVSSESQPSNGDQFKFAGIQYDALDGLYFDNARFYDSPVGRFVSQDPTSFASGDLNLYRYSYNNPTDGTDVSGLQFTPDDYLLTNDRYRAAVAKANALLRENAKLKGVGKFNEGEFEVKNPEGKLHLDIDAKIATPIRSLTDIPMLPVNMYNNAQMKKQIDEALKQMKIEWINLINIWNALERNRKPEQLPPYPLPPFKPPFELVPPLDSPILMPVIIPDDPYPTVA
jgi:RHS repeat-associated protein